MGKKSGYEDDIASSFPHEVPEVKPIKIIDVNNFDEVQKQFLEVQKLPMKQSSQILRKEK